MTTTSDAFEPKILTFLCNWCSYAGADKAGTSQLDTPPNVRAIRGMCSGRIDPQFILEAYRQGADGVVILACHPGDCHYKEGNYHAAKRHRIMLRLLRQFGIDEARCQMDYVSAGQSEKYVQVLTHAVESVRALGPLQL